MDDIDSSILGILKRNGRESFTAVAKALGVTEGTVRNRVKRLVKSGEIKRFTIDHESPVAGLVILKSSLKSNKELISKLKAFSENIFEISGEHDVALIVDANSIDELNRAVDGIRALKGVASTTTAVKLR